MIQNTKPDIVRILECEGLSLKKRGRDLWALCPFHEEKTASFKVSTDKQIFHCFGCGHGGDVITFVMLHHQLSFKDALSHLGLSGHPAPRPIDSSKIYKRKLIEAFRKWEKSYYRSLCQRRLLCVRLTRCLATMEQVEERAAMIHALPEIEYRLDILWYGSDEEKFALWKEAKNGL